MPMKIWAINGHTSTLATLVRNKKPLLSWNSKTLNIHTLLKSLVNSFHGISNSTAKKTNGGLVSMDAIMFSTWTSVRVPLKHQDLKKDH